jgi:NADH:ubiquinone reductase (non-electrogenic)
MEKKTRNLSIYIKKEMYVQRHPQDQLPYDPEKKTIVILGSGWASTSLLKDIDTDHYNVVM